jgi:predicted molibdopterin-dependent oxidoreductase YjgC
MPFSSPIKDLFGKRAPKAPGLSGEIDGRTLIVPKDCSVLDAARIAGISIPTLCHHEGLPPDGNCRVCISEINGKLAVSCLFPLRENGFKVLTDSPRVREARRFILSLLINRAPKAPRIKALAEEYGAFFNPRFARDPDNCIRCGRCVRSCKINGTEAIALVGRGEKRRVTSPFERPPADCVGCLSCALVCPAGNIPFKETRGLRIIWDREFRLVPCPDCGTALFTEEQLNLYAKPGDPLCPECKKRRMAKSLKTAGTFLVKDVLKFGGDGGGTEII